MHIRDLNTYDLIDWRVDGVKIQWHDYVCTTHGNLTMVYKGQDRLLYHIECSVAAFGILDLPLQEFKETKAEVEFLAHQSIGEHLRTVGATNDRLPEFPDIYAPGVQCVCLDLTLRSIDGT